MTYSETLAYLYSCLPMYQRVGAQAFKKDLTNTLALCAHLGNPHERFISVHVAGTNGKGSVSHMLSAVAQAAGLKTGLYTSPHYKDFRERIKVNGKFISRQAVVGFVERHREAIERIQPSFFELTVAMAFDHFAQQKVDLAVIEVGLGGRLDSTNVITPLLSVITNIAFDHMDMLGDTLPLIAGEKAGIIKPGVPVVVGETHPETAPVFTAKASETGSAIVFADQNIRVTERPEDTPGYSLFDADLGDRQLENLRVNAEGPYLPLNLVTALEAWRRLGFLPDSALRYGLENLRALANYIGRWQFIDRRPDVLIDSAHNEAGLRSIFSRLAASPYPRVHVLFGTVNDKDLGKTLPVLPTNAQYYFAKADIPRGLEATILQEKAAEYGLNGRSYRSVKAALRAARKSAQPEDLILVTGSIFVVAEIL